MISSSPDHWDRSFSSTPSGDHTSRGWYQSSAAPSWLMIGDLDPSTSAVDIGAGASVWVDEALDRGWSDLTVLDWSPVALDLSQARLGARAASVTWVEVDVLTWTPPRTFGLWHDRAVLHFLLEDDDRARYGQVLRAATAPGSVVVIGGFGPSGPEMCAGLPVRRQSVADFEALFGTEFTIERTFEQSHVRPDKNTQDYLWVRALRNG
ncbi:MAG: class I SAM-dependent methyltransferase [Actinomycetota bacterium]|nr:class I SAM-dependent methyltransferase [Actinomycetota bacterium]